ncbi:MAG: signal recognition particle-docking protein FtsY [Rhodospirillaceae bacterium]
MSDTPAAPPEKKKKKGGFFSSLIGPRDASDFEDYKEKPSAPAAPVEPEPAPDASPEASATAPDPESAPAETTNLAPETGPDGPAAPDQAAAPAPAPTNVVAESPPEAPEQPAPPAAEDITAPEAAPDPSTETPATTIVVAESDSQPVGEPDPTVEQTETEAPAETDTDTAVDSEIDTDEEPAKLGFFARLRAGLARSADKLVGGIMALFTTRTLDDEALEELEDLLITADLGVETATKLTESLAKERFGKSVTGDEIRAHFAQDIAAILEPVAQPMQIDRDKKPFVVLVVGVNGSGKTTTIGKMAKQFRKGQKLSVMLAAGDTFRAAAVEQLKIWGQRTKCPVIARDTGADSAGLAFDALKQAQEDGHDVLLIDTAGRLQNKAELMAELEKVIRVLRKLDPEAPHAVLQVLDATVGQNAHNQVEVFQKVTGVTGLAMTKLDGTAKGGVVVALADKFGLPVHFVGVGEGVDDLRPFEAEHFAKSLMGLEEG